MTETIRNFVVSSLSDTRFASVALGYTSLRNLSEGNPKRMWTMSAKMLPTTTSPSLTLRWDRNRLMTPKIRIDQLNLDGTTAKGTIQYRKKQRVITAKISLLKDEFLFTYLRFDFENLPLCAVNRDSRVSVSFFDSSNPTCPIGCISYTVQKGDSCYGIANAFSIKIEQLEGANEVACDNLQVGQNLCIPGTVSYTVRNGDTCFSIADAFLITVDQLQKANFGLNCDGLQVGQQLTIVSTSEVIISSGDTCFSLAQRFQISLDQLEKANPTVNCDNLQVGDKVNIPKTTTIVVIQGTTCDGLANLFDVTVESILTANPGINCQNLQVGQTLYIPLNNVSKCNPSSFPNPLTPQTSNPPIVGFWYLGTDTNCVQDSQVSPPDPGTATLSCYFEYYIGSLIELDLKQTPYPCFGGQFFSGGLAYNNYFYKSYCLGNGNTDWVNESKYVTADLISKIKAAGYNSVVVDVEQKILKSEFNRIFQLIKDAGLSSFLYSFQYAEQAFSDTDPTQYNFQLCDYGIPSVYGGCNTAKLCNQLKFWVDNGFSPERLVLAIVKGTWDTVQTYSFGPGTVASSGFAGYIEWNYNLYEGNCKNYINCSIPDPC